MFKRKVKIMNKIKLMWLSNKLKIIWIHIIYVYITEKVDNDKSVTKVSDLRRNWCHWIIWYLVIWLQHLMAHK